MKEIRINLYYAMKEILLNSINNNKETFSGVEEAKLAIEKTILPKIIAVEEYLLDNKQELKEIYCTIEFKDKEYEPEEIKFQKETK